MSKIQKRLEPVKRRLEPINRKVGEAVEPINRKLVKPAKQKIYETLDEKDFFNNAPADEHGFFYGNQAKSRANDYEIATSLKKLSNATSTPSALSKGLGNLGGLFSSGFCATIPKLFSNVEKGISFVFKKIAKLEKNLLKFCQALYIPKTILFITILLIALLEFISRWVDFLEV